MGKLEGKTVMVTGAGTGFGQRLATAAAEEGATHVVVHFRSSSAGAEKTADRVRAAGAKASVIQGDITSWGDVKRMAQEVFERLGSLDVLVNNVGEMASDQTSWTQMTEESIDHVLNVDIKGNMLMVHEFGQRMAEQDGIASIVNIGSTVIVDGSPRAPQYAAGKYGLLGVTKSYARIFAPSVRVNIFAPGFMETEALLEREGWKGGREKDVLARTPMGRIPKPEELTGAALFLASDDANHMTGGYMICNGGFHMLGA